MLDRACIKDYLGIDFGSDLELVTAVEQGFPTSTLDCLSEKGLATAELSDLIVSVRALRYRKARSGRLSCRQTERAVRLATVLSVADQKFDDYIIALHWLRAPYDSFEGRTPLSLLKCEAGGRAVVSALGQIG